MVRLLGCLGMGLGFGCGVLFTPLGAFAQSPSIGSFDEPAPAPRPAPPSPAGPAPVSPATAPAPATASPTPGPADSAPLPAAPPAPPAAASPAPAASPDPAYSEPPEPRTSDEEEEEAPRKQSDSDKHVSITMSPLHLLLPLFEAQVEFRPVPHFGIAPIFGIGSIKASSVDSSADAKFSAYEVGAQLVGYPLRDFSSLQLGAEIMYIHVSTEKINGQQVTAAAGGVAAGPLVGYKVLTQAGFTFFVQGGFEYVFIKASASDNQGQSASKEQDSVIPLLNLNLGWSF